MKVDNLLPVPGRAMALFQISVVILLGAAFFLWSAVMNSTRPDRIGGSIKERGGGIRSNYSSSVVQPAPLDKILSEKALEFVMSRKNEYVEAGLGVNWKLRGVGFLYTMKDMVLAAEVHSGDKSVHIFNVMPRGDTTSSPRDDCNKLSLWVRVYGPEVYAGSPAAVAATATMDCYWKFDFDTAIPGTYAVDAKVLLWNSRDRDYESEQACRTESKNGEVPRDFVEKLYPKHAGFKGFKLYYPAESCCEICNRLAPHCKFWTSPPIKLKGASYFNNGCEIYFDSSFPESEIPRSWIFGDVSVRIAMHPANRRLAVDAVFGMPAAGIDPQHYLGCGWSYWFTLDFPCLSGEKDDQIFLLNSTVEVSALPVASSVPDDQRPLCSPNIELMGNSKGRWVHEPYPHSDECPLPYQQDPDFNSRFPIHKHDGDHPHCWNREDISVIGDLCVEMNCRFIDTTRYWNSRARVKDWYGVWREEGCDYLEFTDKQLQQCVTSKKITNLKVEGRSISENLQVYLDQRVAPLTLYADSTDPDSVVITVTTLSLLHRTRESDRMIQRAFQRLPNATKQQQYFYMSGYFTSSEREPYTHMERMKALNYLADKLLVPKGYKPLNAFDPSAAWAYDSDGQRDGMHIIGPPVRSVVTKLFHFLCHDAVEGSRQ